MERRIVEVELPGGAVALVQATEIPDEVLERAEKVGWGDRFDFDEVAATLTGVTKALRGALDKVAPDKVTVELGVELVVKAGKLTALIVEGQGTATLKITLEWSPEEAGGGRARGG